MNKLKLLVAQRQVTKQLNELDKMSDEKLSEAIKLMFTAIANHSDLLVAAFRSYFKLINMMVKPFFKVAAIIMDLKESLLPTMEEYSVNCEALSEALESDKKFKQAMKLLNG